MRFLLEQDLKPSDIMTRASFLNALTVIGAVGGSTNAVIHLIAMARAMQIDITLKDFQAMSDKTPLLCDFKPSGKYVMEDLHYIGGVPAVMKYLLSKGMLDGSCMTITGKTVAQNLADIPSLPDDQKIVATIEHPLKPTGHIQILFGNLAPEGSVAKITGKEGEVFSGPANVFDSEEEMVAALEKKLIKKGDVIVIRYEGPTGGPGMPEMLTPTSAIMGAGLGKEVALITDGRFSGGSHGFIVGHISPEAQKGGPLSLVQNGDQITIDAVKNVISVAVTDAVLAQRKESWKAPALKAQRGTLYKYIKNVTSASMGCVTDE